MEKRSVLLKGVSKEQYEMIKGCKSSEELLDLAKKEGVNLTDEQLEYVSGGKSFCSKMNGQQCPECNGWLDSHGDWEFYCPACDIVYDYEDIIKC